MDNPIDVLRNKIKELEIELQDFKTALRVMESLETRSISDPPKSLITFSEIPQRVTLRDRILKIISESNSPVSTDDIINIRAKEKGIDRKTAGNSVYPTLSNLAKEGKIEGSPNPNGNGSCWKMKE